MQKESLTILHSKEVSATIDFNFIYSTLEKCLKGNLDENMISESLELIEYYRDDVPLSLTCFANQSE